MHWDHSSSYKLKNSNKSILKGILCQLSSGGKLNLWSLKQPSQHKCIVKHYPNCAVPFKTRECRVKNWPFHINVYSAHSSPYNFKILMGDYRSSILYYLISPGDYHLLLQLKNWFAFEQFQQTKKSPISVKTN